MADFEEKKEEQPVEQVEQPEKIECGTGEDNVAEPGLNPPQGDSIGE